MDSRQQVCSNNYTDSCCTTFVGPTLVLVNPSYAVGQIVDPLRRACIRVVKLDYLVALGTLL